jgi:SOS regulatory protein LexA
MEALTNIQQAVYDYTRKALQQGRPFPSLRDIANHFGFQHTTARFHLKALEKKGYVRQRSQRVSDYLLPDQDELNTASFNLVARIPAGAPVAVYDETPQAFAVTHDFFGGGDVVGLRVVGDSMSGDSIDDGDIAMIKRQHEGTRSDILALRIDAEITLKRLRIDGDKAQLLPSNPEHSVRIVAASQVEILGKLVGIIRKI